MDYREALKRLKQETCPCTYNTDFDKDECLKVLENAIADREEVLKTRHRQIIRYNEDLVELKRFAEVVIKKQVRMHWLKGSCLERYNRDIEYNFKDYASDYMLTQVEFDLINKVVEKYGK